MIDFEQEEHVKTVATIKVIGVGGAGGNTVNSIADAGVQKIELIAANTDAQALELSKAVHKVQLGVKSTKGLGTGSNPEVGRRAAEEDLDKVLEVVKDADIVFLTAGMGGGTGSGALPVIAQALKERGILTLAVVTKPFIFEGKKRAHIAHQALEKVKEVVDTLIVVPNQKLLEIADKNISMLDAFSMINEVLSQSVKGISDIITSPGHINVDFADLKTIMQLRGYAVLGSASASGEHRATEAALKAITSPLLEEVSIEGARGVLLNITGGPGLGLHEISEAASVIQEQVHDQAHIILGSVIDETMNEDEVLVTLIATGFDIGPNVPQAEVESLNIMPAQSTSNTKLTDIHKYQDHISSELNKSLENQNLDIPTFLREK
jgi:cell division protein FtsZ